MVKKTEKFKNLKHKLSKTKKKILRQVFRGRSGDVNVTSKLGRIDRADFRPESNVPETSSERPKLFCKFFLKSLLIACKVF
jgi:hypothetical protein